MDVRKASWVVAFPVWQSFRWAIVLSVIFLACPLFLPAQENQAPDPIAPSGLAADNLNRVAASATQVEELLRKEPGLLVELKRWVAKEATDRGQILDDTELTDQAIFERLTRDLEFRSVATRLLQRYGYLMPNLNPDSEAARERELLFSERTRRMTRAEAGEDNVLEENGSERKLKRAEVCGSTSDRECAEPRQQRERDTGGSYPQSPVPERSPSNLRDQMVARQARENSNEEPDISARQRVQTIAGTPSGSASISR